MALSYGKNHVDLRVTVLSLVWNVDMLLVCLRMKNEFCPGRGHWLRFATLRIFDRYTMVLSYDSKASPITK